MAIGQLSFGSAPSSPFSGWLPAAPKLLHGIDAHFALRLWVCFKLSSLKLDMFGRKYIWYGRVTPWLCFEGEAGPKSRLRLGSSSRLSAGLRSITLLESSCWGISLLSAVCSSACSCSELLLASKLTTPSILFFAQVCSNKFCKDVG